MFIVILSRVINASKHSICALLSNLKREIQPTLINLNPNEYSQKFNYFLFVTKLDRYAGSCNTINNLSNKVYVPNKTDSWSHHYAQLGNALQKHFLLILLW